MLMIKAPTLTREDFIQKSGGVVAFLHGMTRWPICISLGFGVLGVQKFRVQGLKGAPVSEFQR